MAHDLRNYRALPAAGFKVVSMASNHAMDWGTDALLDCIRRLRQDNIAVIGAGADIEEARQAAVLDCKGTRIALLSYCSVAPKGYYASKGKAGVAPMRAITHYEPLEEDQPGTPAEISTYPLEEDLQALSEDVRKAKDNADAWALWSQIFTFDIRPSAKVTIPQNNQNRAAGSPSGRVENRLSVR